ncbi:unnamed protein product [Caenorhabditis angaria]|uniref:T20D4.11-like domain-containing protein n=1 Tax=Caenorhabditis angaria TaxID=860376 RepID=A0A9P1N4K3_9PELO|nr:unnamed protein product [Caenorhabditis angaria]
MFKFVIFLFFFSTTLAAKCSVPQNLKNAGCILKADVLLDKGLDLDPEIPEQSKKFDGMCKDVQECFKKVGCDEADNYYETYVGVCNFVKYIGTNFAKKCGKKLEKVNSKCYDNLFADFSAVFNQKVSRESIF